MYFSFSTSPPATSYTTAPMDIPSSSTHRQTPSCAYPSWPRRSSLSSDSNCASGVETHATSFISDDDLFPCVFDDAEADCTPPATPSTGASRSPSITMFQQQQVMDSGALMRELIAQEKEARKERRRRRSGSSRKSRSTSSKPMTPISEVGE